MTEVQVLSKVLTDKNIKLITQNNLTEEYFSNYPDEYTFIVEHYVKYNTVPDVETFLDKFPTFQVLQVLESEEFLINSLTEEMHYSKIVPILNKVADLLQTNSYEAVDYLKSMLPELIQTNNRCIGKNIVKNAKERYETYMDRVSGKSKLLSTGFLELDELVGGFNEGEEFVVILARTGEGKTWVLLKMLEENWKNGLTVGLVEPEMTYDRVGYRFDTLNANISNTSLIRGTNIVNYKTYIDRLSKQRTPFVVATPKDFSNNITVSKLRTFCEQNKIDMLGIDGISYLRDERGKKTDNKTTSLTNISEDLMDLSIDLGIPILCVVQSNRTGVGTNDAPDLESVRDSDGISFNASMVLSLKQKEPGIEIIVRKHRNGQRDGKVLYAWEADKGKFLYVPAEDDNIDNTQQINQQRTRFRDRGEAI